MDLYSSALISWCGAVPLAQGTALALLVAGLVGAPAHCGAMCGGFVLGQVSDRLAAVPAAHMCEWRRLAAAALLPYHLGRLTTYTLLGAVAGFGSATLAPRWLAAVLLLLAAAAFLFRGLLPLRGFVPKGWSRLVGRLSGRVRHYPFGLGAALGLLPCGFLYAALAVAAASGGPFAGAVGMLAFGIGTVPTLVAVGVAGHLAGQRWRQQIARWSPALMLLNAALLLVLAARAIQAAA